MSPRSFSPRSLGFPLQNNLYSVSCGNVGYVLRQFLGQESGQNRTDLSLCTPMLSGEEENSKCEDEPDCNSCAKRDPARTPAVHSQLDDSW
jgi:hypothetical protein